MSFSQKVKHEICKSNKFEKSCCRKAQLYGILFFSNIYRYDEFRFYTENSEVAKKTALLANAVSGANLSITKSLKNSDVNDELYILTASNEDAHRLFEVMGYDQNSVSIRLNRANLECETCVHAFISGAFLASGSIVSPEKGYHLEVVSSYANRARDLLNLLNEIDITSNMAARKSKHIVYIKFSELIEDFLNIVGAQNASFDLMNVKIFKDIRNRANRAVNCETANLSKAVSAASVQIEAIMKLKKIGLYDSLNDALKNAAELRLKNPEATLNELSEISIPKISKSGLNHRLKKIIELSKSSEVE